MVVLNQLPVVFGNSSMDKQIDRLLGDAIQSVNEWSQSWEPSCNVFEDEEGFTVQIALPGLEATQIDVQVENNMLRVTRPTVEGGIGETLRRGCFCARSDYLTMRTMRNPWPRINMDC